MSKKKGSAVESRVFTAKIVDRGIVAIRGKFISGDDNAIVLGINRYRAHSKIDHRVFFKKDMVAYFVDGATGEYIVYVRETLNVEKRPFVGTLTHADNEVQISSPEGTLHILNGNDQNISVLAADTKEVEDGEESKKGAKKEVKKEKVAPKAAKSKRKVEDDEDEDEDEDF